MKATRIALPRRRFLQLGLGAAAVFAVAGGAAWLWRPGLRDGRLTESGRAVFGAVSMAVLEGSLAPQTALLDKHLSRLEEAIAGFPKVTQDELAQLLGLLSIAAGRLWFTGLPVDWAQASVAEVEAALRRMRASDHELRQQAYHALRDLTNAAFYAHPEHWSLMNYPGPTEV
jgi:hypothetical protein